MMTVAHYTEALVSAWEEVAEAKRSAVLNRFVETLVSDRAEVLAPNIILAVTREVADRAVRRRVVVEVAHEKSFPKTIAVKLQAETKVTAKVIGGFRVRREGEIIDASAAGALKQMRRALAN